MADRNALHCGNCLSLSQHSHRHVRCARISVRAGISQTGFLPYLSCSAELSGDRVLEDCPEWRQGPKLIAFISGPPCPQRTTSLRPRSHGRATRCHRPAADSVDASEEQLIGFWLHGKSPNTIRAYRQDITAFRAFIGKPIRLAYLGDLQRYTDALIGSPASCAWRLQAVKPLLSLAARMGFTRFNIGAAIRPPRPDERLAENAVGTRIAARPPHRSRRAQLTHRALTSSE